MYGYCAKTGMYGCCAKAGMYGCCAKTGTYAIAQRQVCTAVAQRQECMVITQRLAYMIYLHGNLCRNEDKDMSTKGKILYAEDELGLSMAVSEILKMEGFEVTAVMDGLELCRGGGDDLLKGGTNF